MVINLFCRCFKKGASYIISSRKNKKSQNKFIKVDNEIKFLRYFSSKKRKLGC